MPSQHDHSFVNDGSLPGDEDEYDELPSVEDEQHITIEEAGMKTPDRFRRN